MNDHAYIIDGKIFESKESYKTFRDTNVSSAFTFSFAPNLTEMLHSIDIKDVNGTVHEMRLSNGDSQNRDGWFVDNIILL